MQGIFEWLMNLARQRLQSRPSASTSTRPSAPALALSSCVCANSGSEQRTPLEYIILDDVLSEVLPANIKKLFAGILLACGSRRGDSNPGPHHYE